MNYFGTGFGTNQKLVDTNLDLQKLTLGRSRELSVKHDAPLYLTHLFAVPKQP
jgi:hypothetical protein